VREGLPTDIASFSSVISAAQTNGWIIMSAALRSFDFASASVTPTGPYYTPARADPLFDI
jgi:hypothetical protein